VQQQVFLLLAGAEMIVTRFLAALQRGDQVVTGRSAPAARPPAGMPVIAPSLAGIRSG
jgi:hypothetical protein